MEYEIEIEGIVTHEIDGASLIDEVSGEDLQTALSEVIGRRVKITIEVY
jgi:hypothetical protein